MSNSEYVQFGNNAYGKPATGLNILRETIMGRELFDYAFKMYITVGSSSILLRKIFRTMERVWCRLDWFFRGWFYSTDFVDIGIKDVKQYYVSETPTASAQKM
jgi:hypothetical protein